MLAISRDSGSTFGVEASKPDAGALRYEEPKFLTGAIYARDSRRLLFKFKRVASRTGTTLNVQRDFTYPDGKLAARERIVYERNAVVLYELDELQIGAVGSARIQRPKDSPATARIEFEYLRQAGGQLKARFENLQPDTLVADMLGPFLAAHWDALQRGEKAKCRYIVVPRSETVGFDLAKESETTRTGHDVLTVKMAASSRFLAVLVEPLFFTIELAPPHRVLQYVGRTIPKIQEAGKWKDLDAVTVFDWKSAR